MAAPVEGSWYKLKDDYGDGHGLLPKGMMGQVTHVMPALTIGVGSFSETVVVRFLEESSVTGRVCQRRVTFPLASFPGMFAAGKEPAEVKRWDDAQNTTGGAS